MLFLRNIPKFDEVIKKFEYKVFNPYTALFFAQEYESNIKNYPEIARTEIKRKSESEPNGFLFRGMNDIALKILK